MVLIAKSVSFAACTLHVSFIIAATLYLLVNQGWNYGVNGGAVILLLLPSFATALTFLSFLFSIAFLILMQNKELFDQISRVELISYQFITVALILIIPCYAYWNFMGLHYY